jgi:hypothetical protein
MSWLLEFRYCTRHNGRVGKDKGRIVVLKEQAGGRSAMTMQDEIMTGKYDFDWGLSGSRYK